MSLWFGQNLQWNKIIPWTFWLYLVFTTERLEKQTDIFSRSWSLLRTIYQGRIPKSFGSISTGDIGLRWRLSRTDSVFFNRILSRAGFRRCDTREGRERGNEQAATEERARSKWLVGNVEPVFFFVTLVHACTTLTPTHLCIHTSIQAQYVWRKL